MFLNQLFETKIVEGLTRTGTRDTAVIGWGRGMGHQGHMYLASSVITQANESNADPYFVVSRTVGKDDPLTPIEKLSIYKRVFSEHTQIFQATSDAAPDFNRILSKLQEHGYKKVIVVLGEDQIKAFQYLKNYNGKATKSGEVLYTFESIDVISRQQTNDPSNSLSGPRATDMRSVLLDPSKLDEDKFAVWRNSMSPKLNDSEVHMIMKLAEHRLKNLSEAAWQKKAGKSKTGGLNAKGVASYRRENPGSKLQTAVTTKPSKLKPGSKDAKRRKSFCARMGGVKGPMKKPNGDPTRKALALRKWNCESIEQFAGLLEDIKFELEVTLSIEPSTITYVTEGFNGEYDDEAGMAESNLHTLARAVEGLLDTIDDGENLPEWAQEKIAKSEMMLVSVWDYLLSQEEQGIDPQMKEQFAEDASSDNGPYEYVVHYNDPKSGTAGTRTVKTAQPAPKSDSPDAKKFFGKWTGAYTAHEKRSNTANRAHDIVSQGEKKTESIGSSQMAGPSGPEFPKDGGNRRLEAMLPSDAFAGTEKSYKLGSKGHLKGKTKRPAKAGDLVGEQGVVKEIDQQFFEGPSISTTLRSIINDIGEPVLQVYSTLTNMSKNFYDSKGDLKGFKLLAAGVGSKWYNTFYFNRLGKELRHLTQQISTKYTTQLIDFLSATPSKFREIDSDLPEILEKIGRSINNNNLENAAKSWINSRNKYYAYLDKLESESEDDDTPITPQQSNKSPTLGQQSSQVDKIVTDILNKVPRNVAGDIRNSISRSPNKLKALQDELTRRGINVPMRESKLLRSNLRTIEENIALEPDKLISLLEKKTESIDEVAGPEKCWPGHRKTGTQPGTGKNTGKRVNKCVKIKESDTKFIPVSEDVETQMGSLINLLESKR